MFNTYIKTGDNFLSSQAFRLAEECYTAALKLVSFTGDYINQFKCFKRLGNVYLSKIQAHKSEDLSDYTKASALYNYAILLVQHPLNSAHFIS